MDLKKLFDTHKDSYIFCYDNEGVQYKVFNFWNKVHCIKGWTGLDTIEEENEKIEIIEDIDLFFKDKYTVSEFLEKTR